MAISPFQILTDYTITQNDDVRKIISLEREMFSAKKKPSTGTWMLLRTAVTDMGLHSFFQSVSLGKLTCCLSALIRIRRGQANSKSPAVDLEGQPALFVIIGLPAQIRIRCRIFFQPLFERGIMRLNFDGFAGFIKIDTGRFLPLSQSGFHIASISAYSTKTGAFLSFFLGSTPAKTG
mgnify:CR=1 FL=1